MIIFNLTKSATEHLYPHSTVKTQGEVIERRQGEDIVIYDRDSNENEKADFVFHVHAIKVKSFYCIIAIEKETRWVHVIHNVKKGNVNDFIQRFHGRLISCIANMIVHAKPMAKAFLDMTINNYAQSNNDMTFVLKTDRSCNTHITQTSWGYQNVVAEHGFPNNELDAMYFDMSENGFIKKMKGVKDYFCPAEVMLVKFCKNYTALTDDEILVGVNRNRKAWIHPNAIDRETLP